MYDMTTVIDERAELSQRLAGDKALRIGIGVLVIVLGGSIAWATLAPLTEGVVATGLVVVNTAHKTVQHLEGGIVEKLHVREGSEVKQGDILLELSQTQVHAELELLESRYYGRMAEIDRLNAERLKHQEIKFSPDLVARREQPNIADILAVQEDLFTVRRRRYDGQTEILGLRINQLEEKIRGLQANQEAKKRVQTLIERDLKRLHTLYQKQLIEEGALIARQQEYEQSNGEIGSITAEIAGTRVAIGEARLEIIQLEHNLRTEVADRITEAKQEWYDTREKLAVVRDQLKRTRVVAPQDGKVIGLTAHTLGGVIPPGSPIMNIVPTKERLVVEGQIRPMDIDNVHSGQEARLRFSAFNQRTTPDIYGHVERISADAFQNDETGEPFYRVRILVPVEEMVKLGDVKKVGPGMPVEIMMTGEERTAMQYLLDPLIDILEKSMVEE